MKVQVFVKQYHPKVFCEKQTKGRIKGLQEVYYLIRPERNKMYIASGKTKSEAWAKAKEVIKQRLLKEGEGNDVK